MSLVEERVQEVGRRQGPDDQRPTSCCSEMTLTWLTARVRPRLLGALADARAALAMIHTTGGGPCPRGHQAVLDGVTQTSVAWVSRRSCHAGATPKIPGAAVAPGGDSGGS